MNQTFHLKRFSRLFVKHTADHYKTYILSFLVLMGILCLAMGFVAFEEGPIQTNMQIPFFMFFLLIPGSMFTSMIFADYGKKNKAIAMLTLPASNLEKYLVGWVYSFVLYQALLIPSFYMVVTIVNHTIPLRPGATIPPLMSLTSTENNLYEIFFFYAVLHSLMLAGSIFFKRTQFVKTALLMFASMLALSYINASLLKSWISKDVVNATPFGSLAIEDHNHIYPVFPPDSSNTYLTVMFLVATLLLWVSSYYMLKEKEV